MAGVRRPPEVVEFEKLICPFSMMGEHPQYCQTKACLAWRRKDPGLCTFFAGFNGMTLHIRYIAEGVLHLAKKAGVRYKGPLDGGEGEGF